MVSYDGRTAFAHTEIPKAGILLINLGTPAAPTTAAVRRYLAEFLWDRRVVELPRLLWWLILHAVVLRVRPRRSARLYRGIWTQEGSPLLVMTRRIARSLAESLQADRRVPIEVIAAMRYGEPSIGASLRTLCEHGVRRLLVFGLYPQYSAATTASTFDAVTAELRRWRWLPEVRFVNHYHDDPAYLQALAAAVQEVWQRGPRGERLLISFHGLPKRNLLAGDPYHCECQATARLLASRLGLEANAYAVTFQSRFGRGEWLRPYTDETLQRWARNGIRSVDVVCPGFAADCLETLEEIALMNREIFLGNGGETYRYIPALNDRPDHIAALRRLALLHMAGWAEAATGYDEGAMRREAAARAARASALGAPR